MLCVDEELAKLNRKREDTFATRADAFGAEQRDIVLTVASSGKGRRRLAAVFSQREPVRGRLIATSRDNKE